MSSQATVYRVFIATPSGLDDERKTFRTTLQDYNETDALQRGVIFVPVGWEDTLVGVGRPQDLINNDLRSCDYFVLVLCDRWGTPTDIDERSKFSSGTEEEFNLAMSFVADETLPMRQVLAFFKAVDPSKLSDPGEQLSKVLAFKRSLEINRRILFKSFDRVGSFQDYLRRHLAEWVRDHEQGARWSPVKQQPDSAMVERVPPLPNRAISTPATPVNDPIGRLLSEGQRLADMGRLTEAETIFAKAIMKGSDPRSFEAYGEFLVNVGRLTQAEVMISRLLEVAVDLGDTAWEAVAHRNIGKVRLMLGDLDAAENLYKKALSLDESRKDERGMAIDFGSIGLVRHKRGDLRGAEEMYRAALRLIEPIGELDLISGTYGHLGLILEERGDLDGAEAMHAKALSVAEEHHDQSEVAFHYGDLGLVYRRRGDLDRAEQMYHKALSVFSDIGRWDGLAIQYRRLAVVYAKDIEIRMGGRAPTVNVIE